MNSLSKMFGSYEATSWLNRNRRALKGRCPADLLKEGKNKPVEELLKQEKKWEKIK
jgi:hypothetical protein